MPEASGPALSVAALFAEREARGFEKEKKKSS
jgi:hypothetical protein